MAPRNNDANIQKKTCPDDRDVDIKTALPCLMHKKHKVVKLVKSQLQKFHEEGMLSGTSGMTDVYFSEDELVRTVRSNPMKPGTSKSGQSPRRTMEDLEADAIVGSEVNSRRNVCVLCYLLAFFLAALLLIFLMVWISAGPLSNSMAHTPISISSFVRTDSICSLEKKYLLRWSKPEYFE